MDKVSAGVFVENTARGYMPLPEIFSVIPQPFYIPIVIAIIVGTIAFFIHRYEKKRREAFRRLAMQIGLSFTPNPIAPPDITTFPIFKLGHGRNAKNLMHGTRRGKKLSIFDYRYSTSSGKNKSTHTQTVYFVSLEQEIPAFTLATEGFLGKLSELFGAKDIDFPENKEFSKKYLLQSEDEQAIRKLFTPSLLSFFAQEETFTIECDGKQLLVYKDGKRTLPKDVITMLATVDRIREQFEA